MIVILTGFLLTRLIWLGISSGGVLGNPESNILKFTHYGQKIEMLESWLTTAMISSEIVMSV